MALDTHGLNFVRYVARRHPLGAVGTIGRQEIHVNDVVMARLLKGAPYAHEPFCENLLRDHLGATSVESIDMSDFEQATHIHDMNQPLPDHLRGRFDTVMDIGTLEHVYNIVQALKNASDLLKPGGQIVHVLPTNNFCGHGFWQFSPELFFSLYSEKNGYRDTEVFVADRTENTRWFQVIEPKDGRRVNIFSSAEVYVLVRSTRVGDVSHENVQQSDYAWEWETAVHDPQPQTVSGLRARVVGVPLVYDRLFPLYQRAMRIVSNERLSGRNPGLRPVSVRAMTG
ncbi:methyltransferase domain-containing protein [Sphingomonas sp. Y38-1Y]|uniref:methyltransferase domain-containing protein n=1 Tax=Sphingomonas sp. Y38-1Y TaxID=3078265 RepID=UPI0028E4C88D|nr:methyltransferase domain-containing protein [Sphingomonas sp. Y38-1Y]